MLYNTNLRFIYLLTYYVILLLILLLLFVTDGCRLLTWCALSQTRYAGRCVVINYFILFYCFFIATFYVTFYDLHVAVIRILSIFRLQVTKFFCYVITHVFQPFDAYCCHMGTAIKHKAIRRSYARPG